MNPLEGFIARYPLLLSAKKVGVAISGGGDSVALAWVAKQAGLPIVLLHMNYGLRGAESDGDEAFVVGLAEELGCEAKVERVAPENESEEELRRLRYEWFATCGVEAILTGHTRDDQAETVLFRLLRGTGPAGLTGIAECIDGFVYRPLLGVSRAEVRDWLRNEGRGWREDSSNENPVYRRNWIRGHLLPLLREELNPRVDGALVSLAEIAREEEQWLTELVNEEMQGLVSVEAGGSVLDCEPFRGLPLALQRRMMRRFVERVKGNLRGLEFAHIEAGVALALEQEGNGRIQIPEVDLMRSFGLLRGIRLEQLAERSPRNFRMELPIPGGITLPDRGGVVLSTLDSGNPYNESSSDLDWDRLRAAVGVDSPLELRNWRPGDCYRRDGSQAPEKVKDLFQKHRIPLWRRRGWPILVLGDFPVWTAYFGASAEFVAGPQTRTRLSLEWTLDRD